MTVKIKKSGFTLAEVLITIGVIGVVASLTLNSLINSYKRYIYETQYKKALSTIQKIIVSMEVENGNIYDTYINMPSNVEGTRSIDFSRNFYSQLNGKYTDFDENNIKPYYTSSKGSTQEIATQYTGCIEHPAKNSFTGNDGIMYKACLLNHNFRNNYIIISFDLNGYHKGPNKWGVDLFHYYINQDDKISAFTNAGISYCPILYYKGTTSNGNPNDGYRCSYEALTRSDYFKKIEI